MQNCYQMTEGGGGAGAGPGGNNAQSYTTSGEGKVTMNGKCLCFYLKKI